jgi:hypothetical protein
LSGVAGVETGSIHSNVPLFNSLGLPAPSVPNRFFDDVRALYYFTDNFELYAGHAYTAGSHFLTLGGEYGIPLGGGRMASLFTQGWIGEGGDNGALVGLRVYFGQRDKSLIDRHRQDDPIALDDVAKSLSHKLEIKEIKPQDQILLQQLKQKLTLANQLQSNIQQQQAEALRMIIQQIK